MKAQPAPAYFPYTDHRTVAEFDRDQRDARQMIAELDATSRRRALSDLESRHLERLLKIAA